MLTFSELRQQDLKEIVFVAEVKDNNHPKEKDGRVQIRIPHLFDSVPNNSLPWARSEREQSSLSIPLVGAKVFVYFQGGNIYDPVYTCDILTSSWLTTNLPAFAAEYPHAIGFGHLQNYIKINRSTGTLVVNATSDVTVNSSGAKVNIVGNSDVNITATTGNVNINATAASVKVNGATTVEVTNTAGASVKLVGPNVLVNT